MLLPILFAEGALPIAGCRLRFANDMPIRKCRCGLKREGADSTAFEELIGAGPLPVVVVRIQEFRVFLSC